MCDLSYYIKNYIDYGSMNRKYIYDINLCKVYLLSELDPQLGSGYKFQFII